MMAEITGRGFDEFAEDYERHAATGAFNALYDRPAVLDALGDVAGLRVLDLGCGPGLYAEALLERGAEVVGCDGSPEMVRLAQRRTGERAALRVHDLGRPLDWLEEESFDRAVMALVIHHLDEVARVALLREIHRLVRPGGRVVVSTDHPMHDWRRLGGTYFDVALVEEVWQGDWRVSYWRQPLEAWCAEFTGAGFVIERIAEPRPAPEMADRFPDIFAELTVAPSFIVFSLLRPEAAG